MEQTLAKFIEHPRGPDRPFSIDEVRVGLPVREMRIENSRDEPHPGHSGQVASWTTDLYGGVALMRVKWDDGLETEHTPNTDEVRRA